MRFVDNGLEPVICDSDVVVNEEVNEAKDLSEYEADLVGDAADEDVIEVGCVYEDELEGRLEHFLQQEDEAIELLDKAGRDFERSLDTITDGLEKMFDSIEGMLEVALKR